MPFWPLGGNRGLCHDQVRLLQNVVSIYESRWDEGYGVTERFLEYCDSLLPSFKAKLNKKMRERYSDAYFVELLGKPVDQLWIEYKAKYGNQPDINTRERLSSLRYCLRLFPMLE